MRKYLPQFFLRGLCAMGFGPIVLAIIYGSLGAAGIAASLTPTEVCLGILSIALMAFIAGGVTMVYQIESLPLLSAILLHGGALYLDYLIMYLLNDWIARDLTAILTFTVIFIVGYALIWLLIFLYNRRKAAQISKKLPGNKSS